MEKGRFRKRVQRGDGDGTVNGGARYGAALHLRLQMDTGFLESSYEEFV